MNISEIIAVIIFIIYIISIGCLIYGSKRPPTKKELLEIKERKKHLDDE